MAKAGSAARNKLYALSWRRRRIGNGSYSLNGVRLFYQSSRGGAGSISWRSIGGWRRQYHWRLACGCAAIVAHHRG